MFPRFIYFYNHYDESFSCPEHKNKKKQKNVEKSFAKQLHLMFITKVNTHSHTLILFYLFSAMFKRKKALFVDAMGAEEEGETLILTVFSGRIFVMK